MTVAPTLVDLGWEPAATVVPKRLVTLLEGFKGDGKTHVALTMPPPIWYFRIDTGDEGVIEKFATQKEIHVLKTSFTTENIADTYPAFRHSVLATAEHVKSTSFGVGTFIVDTWDEVYENGRVYYFGQQTSEQRNYGPIFLDMRQMNRAIQDTGCNAVFIHKMASFRGETYPKGWKDFNYEVQMVIRLSSQAIPHDPTPNTGSPTWTRFLGHVTHCRQNPNVQGLWLTSDQGTLDLTKLMDVVHG